MAEGAPLLRVYGLTPIEGSNPSFSAIQIKKALCVVQGAFFICIEYRVENTIKDNMSAKHAYLRVIYTRKYGSKKSSGTIFHERSEPEGRNTRTCSVIPLTENNQSSIIFSHNFVQFLFLKTKKHIRTAKGL